MFQCTDLKFYCEISLFHYISVLQVFDNHIWVIISKAVYVYSANISISERFHILISEFSKFWQSTPKT